MCGKCLDRAKMKPLTDLEIKLNRVVDSLSGDDLREVKVVSILQNMHAVLERAIGTFHGR